MQKETKNYATVTFLCRGSQYRAMPERAEGRRMLDWLQDGAVADEETAVRLAGQLIRLLRGRALSCSSVMRGFVSPYVFIVDGKEEIHLLDLEEESNQAMARKIQTASVMRYFTPEDLLEEDPERAEIYGFARLMQFALDNGGITQRMSRAGKTRWRRFLDRCTGDGPRRIKDFDQAEKAFASFSKTKAASKERSAPRLRRPLLIAACILTAVLLCKKGVYDQAVASHLVRQDQERLTGQLREMEDSLDELRQDQKKLERQLKNQ